VTQFSIFLPVRNGWPYVQECVESILNQSYPHFELVILDNQSTDNTIAWLRSITDPRVRLHFSSKSLSIVDSWARILEVEKREFMTLIGHDDRFERGFLEAVKKLIDDHPGAGLYQTGSRLIDSNGKTIRPCRPCPERETAAEYLTARFKFERDVFGTGYVMRSADYDRVGGIPGFEKLFFADDALWLSMMRGSCKASDPAEHFAVRIHPKSESASLPSAWSAIVTGLNQFAQFLASYDDADSQSVIRSLGAGFQLNYHRNAYIFALIAACQAGRKVEQATRERIESSLASCAPQAAGQLRGSAKVVAIEALNASPFRGLVPLLWRAYYRLKSQA
jgi:glycosyltransferase involved in cell wall biosynthesis